MRDGGHKASGRQLAAQAAPPRMVGYSTYAEGAIPDRYRDCHPDLGPRTPTPTLTHAPTLTLTLTRCARLLGDKPEQELGELGAVRGQQRAVHGAQQRRPRRPQLRRGAALGQVMERQLHQRM